MTYVIKNESTNRYLSRTRIDKPTEWLDGSAFALSFATEDEAMNAALMAGLDLSLSQDINVVRLDDKPTTPKRLMIEFKRPTPADPYCPRAGWWCHVLADNEVIAWNVGVCNTLSEAEFRRDRFAELGSVGMAFRERYQEPMTDERLTELVADGLTARGMTAASVQTGGWIYCVEIQHAGQVFLAGMSGDTWGADGYASVADYEASNYDDGLRFEVAVPADSHDINAIVTALHEAVVNAPIVRAKL